MSDDSVPAIKMEGSMLKINPEVWTFVNRKGKLAQHIWLQPEVLAWLMTQAAQLGIAPNQLIAAIVTSAYMNREALVKIVEPIEKEIVKEIDVYMVTCTVCKLLNKTVRLPIEQFIDHVKNEHCAKESGQ